MDITDALQSGAVDLIGTATAFGQGAIASQISGSPYYSDDPAAAAYATATAGTVQAPTAPVAGLGLFLMVGAFLYVILKK